MHAGAVVGTECGHACHLMEVDCMDGSPQVHIHFLTEEFELSLTGYSKVELCCHGCGESVLVYYTVPEEDDNRHIDLRDAFHEEHKLCPDRDYENVCPNFRTKFSVVDLRVAPPKRRAFRGSRSHGRREGHVSAPGPSVIGSGRRTVRKEASKG